jgi:23S rRNA (guanosine2251-2'-O)-methyltransferase
VSGATGLVGGRRAVAEAIRAGRARAVVIATGARSTQGLREVLSVARSSGVPVRQVPRSELDRRAERLHLSDHQGVVAEIDPPATWSERDLARARYRDDAIAVVLDGVTDPQNLGASARSAEAAGADVFVTRVRRAAPVSPAAVAASAGALLHLPHARVANIPRALDRLAEAGFTLVGLDGDAPRSIADEPCPEGRIAVVIGSEDEGLARLTRERCDLLVSLPMRGQVRSLNAAASLAAVLYAYVLPSRYPDAGDRDA